jgi:hypothetical protein
MTPEAADPAFAAVIFDIDGVVTDTAGLHAAAWQYLFDETLPLLAGGRDVEPFDIEADYHAHLDGRSREDGVRGFLASRGLAIPDDSAVKQPSMLTCRTWSTVNSRFSPSYWRHRVWSCTRPPSPCSAA